MKENRKEISPESYPRPSMRDTQLKNQPEFIDQQPNDFFDKSISDIPAENIYKLDDRADRNLKREL